jgi:hypothetical protein
MCVHNKAPSVIALCGHNPQLSAIVIRSFEAASLGADFELTTRPTNNIKTTVTVSFWHLTAD